MVNQTIREYRAFHDEGTTGTVESRKANYAKMVNAYYDLATDFYEYGWGQSFHFGVRHRNEGFAASLLRHELYLAHRLGVHRGDRILDLGCGVGGPMRAIAQATGANVLGINNNAYQIEKGEAHNRRAKLDHLCRFQKADFLNLPLEDGSFDGAFSIEATCHAPDRLALFSEIFRVLKPGAQFASYEWCLTDRFDPSSSEHQRIKKGIEEGDGLPDLINTRTAEKALVDAGFELVERRDRALDCDPETPWYLPLDGRMTLDGFRHTRLGRKLTHRAVSTLEALKIAPEGSTMVSETLMLAASALVEGGKLGIFTPMHFVLAKKPA